MRPAKIVALVSTVTALLAGAIAYIDDLDENDPPWLIAYAVKYKSKIALALFVLTVLLALGDWFRSYIDERHQEGLVLNKVLNELSRTVFPQGARRNRITLFNLTSGWRIFLWGLVRIPIFGKAHKWRALFRVKWMDDYLGVYLRPTDSRGRKSTAAFRVSDNDGECEGVAGRIWASAGQVIVAELPRVDAGDIRRIASLSQLEANATVKEYAEKSNMLNYHGFDACDLFARHYYGTLIRQSDGSPWGVLLLDSFEDVCPFMADGEPSESFVQRFNDFATVIGRVVS